MNREEQSGTQFSGGAGAAPAAADLAKASNPVCSAVTKHGRPCRATPGADGMCPWHSGRYNQLQRQAWARRGALAGGRRKLAREKRKAIERLGLEAVADTPLEAVPDTGELTRTDGPDLSTLAGCRGYLERTAGRLERGELAPSVVNALANLVNLGIKLAELQLDAQLADQLAQEPADRRIGGRR